MPGARRGHLAFVKVREDDRITSGQDDSGFCYPSQVPHTEFSKGRQLDRKVIGVNTDGAAGNVDFQSFRKRQRGADISVHRNRVARIARRAGKLQSGAEIILAHRNRRKLCRKAIRMAHDPRHECIRIRPGPDEVTARRAVGISLNGGFDGRNEPLRRLAFKLIDHAGAVAVPIGIGRIGVLAHRHAPAHHVKPRPGGFARELHDDRHMLGENALPLPRPAGQNHDLCGLCCGSVRQDPR